MSKKPLYKKWEEESGISPVSEWILDIQSEQVKLKMELDEPGVVVQVTKQFHPELGLIYFYNKIFKDNGGGIF